MMHRFLEILLGTYTFSVPLNQSEKVLNALHINKNTTFSHSSDNDRFYFHAYIIGSKNLLNFLKKGIGKFEVTEKKGLPVFAGKYCKRAGLYIGIFLFFLIIWLSGRFVWSMEVKGNKTVTDASIIEKLNNLGFSIGTGISRVDFDVLQNKYLATYDDLCWISVNMTGTHASVEVKELSDFENNIQDHAVNIVAAESGKIKIVETFEGMPCVEPGEYVGKGDLLISGIIDSTDKIRFEAASGRVLAEITRYFSLSSKKEREVKSYTGRTAKERELIFFKKRVKLSKNSGIRYIKYDTIENNRQLYLFNSIPLPLFINNTEYKEYIHSTQSIETGTVNANLSSEFTEKLKETLGDGEMIDYTVERIETNEEIQLICKVNCIDDIAEEKILDIALK